MGKYYCDYCDIYLTHDSMNARKAHNTGRNHVSNVRDYFASLGHDKAQNIIDAIIQQHESGGRGGPMMGGPPMRLGSGFLNPMTGPPGAPPFPPGGFPAGVPPFRPPFPPTGAPGAMPPFPPPGQGMPPFAPNGAPMPPFPPPGMGIPSGMTPPQMNGGFGSPAPPSFPGPPQGFTPAAGPPPGGAPGIHPDRLRMMGV